MKPVLFLALLSISSRAELLITEVMSVRGHTTLPGARWELTNAGTGSVSLDGYTFGSPNNWLDGATPRTQNFLPFRPTAFIKFLDRIARMLFPRTGIC
jgi:hypothetical protein